ncbi:hypothetical protein GOV12_04135 [Candidatus Pacearchaeota archaeon]|nr:hypothetical protein [Candidatus Pacearchaeota archaeon]
MKIKKLYFGIIVISIAVISLVYIISISANENYPALQNYNGQIDFYKSLSCGCCDVHASYLRNSGGLDVNIIEVEDISKIKSQYNIPKSFESCHTVIIGGYFVEGHIPLEAINKLIADKPDINGILLPGMPSGSPGMPGRKNSEWIIYSMSKDSTTNEFMRI